MRVYLGSNHMYGFDKQRTFRAGYIAGSSGLSQEHRKHDESNIGQ